MKLTICLVLINFIILNTVNALNKNDCICRSMVKSRIINGGSMNNDNYPWIAEIYATEFKIDAPVCAASILNERFLLSAASCMPAPDQLDQMKIRIRGIEELIGVEKVILHPNFTQELFYAHDDIALIKINETLKFNKKTITPGCLDTQVTSYFPKSLNFAGRGSTEPVRINKETGMASNFKPSKYYMEGFGFDKTSVMKECINNKTINLCVQTKSPLCIGEQGAPIQKDNFGTNFIVGVASLPIAKHLDDKTVELCTSGIKAARVHHYIDWIKENLDGSEFCTGSSKKR